MTPVDQSQFYQEEPRQYGDCVRAVLASLLDLPLSEVPHFLQDADGHAYEFYSAIEEFLGARGLEMDWQRSLVYYWRPGDADLFHFMSGPSPRGLGIGHAVIGLNGVPFFDPHPSRAMLAGDPAQWICSFLVTTTKDTK